MKTIRFLFAALALATFACEARAQNIQVQADQSTGLLWRPSTFFSNPTNAAAIQTAIGFSGGLISGANGGTGVANTGKTITLGGNVTTSGAFGLTLTLTGTTGVTLPTTGTLATLAGTETLTNKSVSLGSNTLTATSAQLATAISDETGSGALVFGTSPTLTTPNIGAATGTSLAVSGRIDSSALRLYSNQLFEYITDADDGTVAVNYVGYNEGTTRFRDLKIFNGKTGLLLSVTGSSGLVALTNALTVGETLSVTGHTTFEGVTSTGATGTGNLVYSASPSLGSIGIGGAANSAVGVYITSTALTTDTQHGILSDPTFNSAATTFGADIRTAVQTSAGSFTLPLGIGLRIDGPVLGSGSAITTVTGILVNNQGAAGVTNAYGIDISAQGGAATNNVGLRNAGTTVLLDTTEATTGGAGAITSAGGIYAAKNIVTSKAFVGSTSAISASDIDWSLSNTFSKTLSANTTFTFSNTVAGQTITVAVTNTASNYTVTWPTVSWSGGSAPVQTVGAKTDVYSFIKVGSTFYGNAVQNF